MFNTLLQFKNYTKNTPYSDVLFELDIKKLFVQILLCSEKVGTGNTYNLYVNKALRYIKQNFNRDISTDDVAAYLEISAVYFQKIFHSATDEKFNRYLNKQRINYAANLLQNTNYSLKKSRRWWAITVYRTLSGTSNALCKLRRPNTKTEFSTISKRATTVI